MDANDYAHVLKMLDNARETLRLRLDPDSYCRMCLASYGLEEDVWCLGCHARLCKYCSRFQLCDDCV